MKVNKISENIYEIPKEGKMLVPGIIYASEELMDKIKLDKTLEQVKNVAQLPGIVGKSIALSDAHQGYGFSIGGVAAFDLEKGIISPGGVGYDINCGVRLLITNIKKIDFMFKRNAIINEIYKLVPSGVGEGTKDKLSMSELDKVLNQGVQWAVEKRYATSEDAERTEDNGCIQGADASKVSQRAKSRGKDQLGTLGSGNHFLEIQEVEKIIDEKIASAFGIDKDNICIMIHTGSRGL
jgi:tRNA-splicing ligase RtcB